MASDLGKEINKLQLRVHRQRIAYKHLKKANRLLREREDYYKQIDHAIASVKDEAQKLKAAMREGALHGISIPAGEDRLEGMALIIQKLRAKNVEQYRALTDLNAAAHYLTQWFSDEDQESVTVARYQAEALIVAVQGAARVIDGDKSNLTKELERQQALSVNYADNVKTMATNWLTDLITRVGPVRKRDLKAAIETIAKL